ncbi:MAG: hypothetical protein FWD76_06185 [Firmicutes bacterium]|nr:hypothetical protein [Bacillota bacterium]
MIVMLVFIIKVGHTDLAQEIRDLFRYVYIALIAHFCATCSLYVVFSKSSKRQDNNNQSINIEGKSV